MVLDVRGQFDHRMALFPSDMHKSVVDECQRMCPFLVGNHFVGPYLVDDRVDAAERLASGREELNLLERDVLREIEMVVRDVGEPDLVSELMADDQDCNRHILAPVVVLGVDIGPGRDPHGPSPLLPRLQ